MNIEKEKEKEFNDWLNSIEFVNEDGSFSDSVLTKDESEDPEDDRGEEA